MSREIDPFDPPAELLLDLGAVGRLNFQTRYCPAPLECFARRHGNVVELTFAWDIRRNPIEGTCWPYLLYPGPREGTLTARRIK